MIQATRILLIDDNEESRHDLETILAFIGESTVPATSNYWQSPATDLVSESSDIAVAIIGTCEQSDLATLMMGIYDWDAGIPFILVGEHEIPNSLISGVISNITTKLDMELRHQSLLDAIHKAKVFNEHFNRLRDFDGVRDYNMFRNLVGKSEAIQCVRQMMAQVANAEVSVLITGESGTGKEVVARNMHLNSARSENPFVPINCGAIPRELLESELFGHEKGAFTDAIASRAGRFELADGGTLFLDEIGDMPLNMQVKLLRVLQDRSFERVGGVKTIQTDVRIMAATHQDLEHMIEEGKFRQDLYYRLNVFPIEVPPLRERAEDLPLLLNELISAMESENRGSVRFNSGAIASLCQHPWLGNVRELANLVERMAIMHPHGIVGIKDLPEKFRHLGDDEMALIEIGGVANESVISIDDTQATRSQASSVQVLLPVNGLDLKEYLTNLEKDLIAQALSDSGGIVARAAGRLQLRRTTLVEKMRKYKLSRMPTIEEEMGAEQLQSGQQEGSPENVTESIEDKQGRAPDDAVSA